MTLFGAVFIVLLALKLAGIGIVATWSWWLVTLPLWIGFAVTFGLALIAGVAGMLAVLFGFTGKAMTKSKYRKYFR